jgi:2-methylcitrate dehydratase PrpD
VIAARVVVIPGDIAAADRFGDRATDHGVGGVEGDESLVLIQEAALMVRAYEIAGDVAASINRLSKRTVDSSRCVKGSVVPIVVQKAVLTAPVLVIPCDIAAADRLGRRVARAGRIEDGKVSIGRSHTAHEQNQSHQAKN